MYSVHGLQLFLGVTWQQFLVLPEVKNTGFQPYGHVGKICHLQFFFKKGVAQSSPTEELDFWLMAPKGYTSMIWKKRYKEVATSSEKFLFSPKFIKVFSFFLLVLSYTLFAIGTSSFGQNIQAFCEPVHWALLLPGVVWSNFLLYGGREDVPPMACEEELCSFSQRRNMIFTERKKKALCRSCMIVR